MQSSILTRVCAVTALAASGMLLLLWPGDVRGAPSPFSGTGVPGTSPPPTSATSPPAPSDLTATAIGPSLVELHWTDHADGEEGYEVERSADGGWAFQPLALLGPDATAHNDVDVAACSHYCYRVRAVAGGEASPYGDVACATTPSESTTTTVLIIDGEAFEGAFPPAGWPGTPWIATTYKAVDENHNAYWYASARSSAPGYIRTLSFDTSDAIDVTVSFWMRSSLTEGYVYEAYLERDGQPCMTLESFPSTSSMWTWKSYTISDTACFSSDVSVSWYARISSYGGAHLDLVTVTKRVASSGPAPTTIGQQPLDQTVCAGAAATFDVAASGANLSYRWESYDGSTWHDLGASGPQLILPGVTDAQDGRLYRAVVSGACATAYSLPATLHVTPTTAVALQPQDTSACAGGAVTLGVQATGSELAYAWQFDDGLGGAQPLQVGPGVSGATTPDLVLSDLDAGDVGSYHCVVAGACGTVLSATAQVALLESTVILQQPADQTVAEDGDALYCVQAQGAQLSHQWESSGDGGATYAPIPGAAEPCLTLPSVSLDDDGRLFRCVASGACNSVMSSPARLSVLRVHTIPLQAGWNLTSMAVHPEDTAIAAVLASVAGQYRSVYAWQGGEWLIYDPAANPPGPLTTLDETRGFWIDAVAPTSLRVTGVPLVEPSAVSLDAGWNLVGYAGWTPHSLPAALSDHGAQAFTLAYGYRAGRETPWSRYEPLAPGWSNALLEMAPGSGYWVHLDAPAVWSLPPE